MIRGFVDKFKSYDDSGQALAVGGAGTAVAGWVGTHRLSVAAHAAARAGIDASAVAGGMARHLTFSQLPITMGLGGAYMAVKQGILPDLTDHLRSAGRDPKARQRVREDLLNTAMWEGAVFTGFSATHYATKKAYNLLKDIPYFQQNIGQRVETALGKTLGEGLAKTAVSLGREALTPAGIAMAIAPFAVGPVMSLAGKAVAFYHQNFASQDSPRLETQSEKDSEDDHSAEQALARSGMASIDDVAISVARRSTTANPNLIANALASKL